jgi:hypothetical protein
MISRRMLLGGSAATLWLPFLASALPRSAWGAAPPPAPRRLLYWFVPNGMLAANFTPLATGENYDLPFPIEPILPIQNRVSVISGIVNKPTVGGNLGTHEECMVGLLSDTNLANPGGPLDGGVTVDQFAAQAMGTATPFASMQLGMDEPWIDSGGNYNTYYTTLSWANGSTPLAQLTDPKTVFDRMFAGSDPALTQEDIDRRNGLRKSLLDSVAERTAALNLRLSAADKIKLDQFTTGVRELETRIDALAALECPTPLEPGQSPQFTEAMSLMIDLMVVAYQCDYTRLFTFMTGASTSLTKYEFLDITTDHHTLSHNQAADDVAKQQLMTIMNWQVSQWTSLCQKLADVQEEGGDLLSNTMVNMISEFGESNSHLAEPIVMLVAGGESAGILQGQHRAYGGAPHSNLWWTELEFMDVDPTGFGENANRAFDLTIPA